MKEKNYSANNIDSNVVFFLFLEMLVKKTLVGDLATNIYYPSIADWGLADPNAVFEYS